MTLWNKIKSIDFEQQGYGRGTIDEMSYRTPMHDTLTPEEHAYCDEACERECRRVVVAMGFVVGTSLLFALFFELVFVKLGGLHDHVVATLPIQIGCAYFTSLALLYWPLARKYTMRFALFMVICTAALGGLVLGGMGGFDGPFFYSIYMVPTFVMLIPCGLGARIFGTLSIMGLFAALFLMQHQTWAFPRPDITFVSIIIIASASVFFGYRNRRILRGRALALYRLNQDRRITRTHNVELAQKLRQQARRAQALNHELMEAKNSERVSIARDLHDDVGQILVGAKMELEMLDRTLENGGHLGVEQLDRLYDVMFGLEDGIKQMIGRLRQDQPHQNLMLALNALFAQYRKEITLDVDVDEQLAQTLDESLSTLVYRTVQEGLTNAAKYSESAHWRVSVAQVVDTQTLRVAVSDRALISPDIDVSQSGWGLLGLRERATQLGGKLTLGHQDCWTVLEVLVPIGGIIQLKDIV